MSESNVTKINYSSVKKLRVARGIIEDVIDEISSVYDADDDIFVDLKDAISKISIACADISVHQ